MTTGHHAAVCAPVEPGPARTGPAAARRALRPAAAREQGKLDATEELAGVAWHAGLSRIELAIAFVVNHPAVTSAIIGPRTMQQLDSQLPAADDELDGAVLDRIDEIVRPGVNPNPADTSDGEHILAPALRRRRTEAGTDAAHAAPREPDHMTADDDQRRQPT